MSTFGSLMMTYFSRDVHDLNISLNSSFHKHYFEEKFLGFSFHNKYVSSVKSLYFQRISVFKSFGRENQSASWAGYKLHICQFVLL